jgi:transposase
VNGDQTDATDYELFRQKFNCSRMTLYRLLVHVRVTGTTSDRRRSGRPREMTLRQDRHITLIYLRNFNCKGAQQNGTP